ncbi:cytochrome c [Noviherbaspirillum sp.]|jgi:mono/diheme cytochrome c family protein|uniref:c-type cytochrome n=1 Tax=Noviherbaspirillum sp. TaxID=1926288 RepID=UPI0025FF86CB|nr:cytochrome c [Noviherbaspirillum sp.]
MLSFLRTHQNTFANLALLAKVLATLLVAILAVSYSSSLYAADTFKGQKLYANNCAVCHGPNGQSRLPGAPNFNRGESILKPDFTLLAAIRAGKNAMPAFQGILSDRDIMDVIAYVRTLN